VFFSWDGDSPVDGEVANGSMSTQRWAFTHAPVTIWWVGWRGLSEETEDGEGDRDLSVGCGLDEDDAISASLFGGCWIWNLVLSHPCITFPLDPSTRKPWLETA
jgi:hypothetical protein